MPLVVVLGRFEPGQTHLRPGLTRWRRLVARDLTCSGRGIVRSGIVDPEPINDLVRHPLTGGMALIGEAGIRAIRGAAV